ncbi:guanine nucleotide exchange protein for ADP-robosylation factor [Massospora cicadina]|nr:guanine nucleotide exchange protein for ADP-robosylation factor [Massospora cicadina]
MSIVISPTVVAGPIDKDSGVTSVTPAATLKGLELNAKDDALELVDLVDKLDVGEANHVPTLPSSGSSFSAKVQPSVDATNSSRPHNLLATGYETLLQAATSKKLPNLRGLTLQALAGFTVEMAREVENSKILVAPLLLACQAYAKTLNRIALPILIDLLNLGYLTRDADLGAGEFRGVTTPLETAVLGICSVHTQTDEKNVTHILRGVISATAYGRIRQDTLMDLVRTLYSIYATSKDINNQVIAQMALLQLARTVFSQVPTSGGVEPHRKLDLESAKNLNAVLGDGVDLPQSANSSRKGFAGETPKDEGIERLTIKQMGSREAERAADNQFQLGICDISCDTRVADAYLLMHAFCKLALKRYYKEYNSEMRNAVLRDKLLALYVLLVLISEFPVVISQSRLVFLTTEPGVVPRGLKEVSFVDGIRPFLNVVLAKNLDHPVAKVYELSLAVFEGIVTNLWRHFKLETEAVMRDVVFPILERKDAGNQRVKHTLCTILLSKLCKSPSLVMDFYLTYDCAPEGTRTKVFYQLANGISRLIISLGRADGYTGFHWDHYDAFQRFARRMDRQDLLKLPPFSTDRFVDNYATRSFFSRYTFVDCLLHYRCIGALYELTKSLLSMVSATPDLTAFELEPLQPPEQKDALQASLEMGLAPLETGILAFNRAPNDGIQYLIHHGIIASDAASEVARFLHATPALDKAKLGIFLTGGPTQALPEFLQLMDFEALEVVTALRRLLNKLWLPPSARRIDAVLLAFAERYADQNPTTFPSPDTVYALSYAILALNVSLHSPRLKWRMTKDDFIDSCRGVDPKLNVSTDHLGEMFDQIHTLAIPFTDPHLELPQVGSDSQWGLDLIQPQPPSVPNQGWVEAYFTRILRFRPPQDALEASTLFHSAPQALVIRRMLQAAWMPCFAAASHIAKYSIDIDSISGAVAVSQNQITLARVVGEVTAHHAFLSYMCASYCHDGSRSLSYRNAYVVLALFRTVSDDPNRLRTFWPPVLKVVEKLLEDGFIHCYTARQEDGIGRVLTIHHLETTKDIHIHSEDLSFTQEILLALDSIFSRSAHLSGAGVFGGATPAFDCHATPRATPMFLFDRVADVAYFNVGRIPVEWRALWAVLGQFLRRLGCHVNGSVATYAINVLHTLAIRQLALNELTGFKYQKAMLSPLVHIIRDAPSLDAKESALQTMQVILESHAPHLRSGWEAILQALTGGAGSQSDDLLHFSFRMAEEIARHHLAALASPNLFRGYLACLAQFANNGLSLDLGLRAVQRFGTTAMAKVAGHAAEATETNFWAIAFRGAADMALEVSRGEVSDKVIALMFSWLSEHGVAFSGQFWEHLLNQILFPLFLHYSQREGEWVTRTLQLALNNFIDLFSLHFERLFHHIDGLLDLLAGCLCRQDSARRQMGAAGLQQLLEGNSERMAEKDWQRVLSIVVRLLMASTKSDLASSPLGLGLGSALTRELSLATYQSSAPFLLAPTTPERRDDVCRTVTTLVEGALLLNPKVFSRLDPSFTFVILDLVGRAYAESHQRNAAFDLVTAIQNQSVLKLERFADTGLALELDLLACLIRGLIKIYASEDGAYQPYAAEIVTRLVPLCRDAFQSFNSLHAYATTHPTMPGLKPILDRWQGVIRRIGNFLTLCDGHQFQTVFAPISSHVFQTLKCHHLPRDVLEMLAAVMERVNLLYIHAAPDPTIDPSTQP